jgi:hypothetical protein
MKETAVTRTVSYLAIGEIMSEVPSIEVTDPSGGVVTDEEGGSGGTGAGPDSGSGDSGSGDSGAGSGSEDPTTDADN